VKVSRHFFPSSLRVEPLIFRLLTYSLISFSLKLLCNGMSGRSRTNNNSDLFLWIRIRVKLIKDLYVDYSIFPNIALIKKILFSPYILYFYILFRKGYSSLKFIRIMIKKIITQSKSDLKATRQYILIVDAHPSTKFNVCLIRKFNARTNAKGL